MLFLIAQCHRSFVIQREPKPKCSCHGRTGRKLNRRARPATNIWNGKCVAEALYILNIRKQYARRRWIKYCQARLQRIKSGAGGKFFGIPNKS